ncbi:putative membrane protein [Bacteroides fragilis str. 3725 D9(v)]|uniref:Putative membrane protein n=1 Tax=Bacteroides fragilis str. 3998T(B)3 TaxID=1339316 RepID=A0A015U840_BACFG|nr:putative membrane protein [Bacteroides fragilis str. 3783N1-2]EXY51602.1 putative membrane protein [Bacteroides fragilis str. 3783N2-1]EXY56406.1 putative membrane protein [Bacteroides fragilis str. 3976T7]EXY77690.1 putative membrane protein [Bacteroides fragilis str. 3988 T1]EXY91047.1 putative membrane protein [Bacteroides fragilis str. 3998T(B)3]EXZ19731.1 putative membrane protein [Bacteroides fragilis str. J-143-4]EXZ49167.1 putative membrane protein [Bacteroides fragilis str. 3397 N
MRLTDTLAYGYIGKLFTWSGYIVSLSNILLCRQLSFFP